jgi:HPt (histidine-containing phosphotransfer) domain-containing protein
MDADWKKMERVTVAVEPDLMGLIPNFLTRKRDDLQTLKDALESGDLTAIARLGHKIKGEGGSFGFDAMSDIGAALEIAGNQSDTEAARQLVADLSDYLEKVDIVEGPES